MSQTKNWEQFWRWGGGSSTSVIIDLMVALLINNSKTVSQTKTLEQFWRWGGGSTASVTIDLMVALSNCSKTENAFYTDYKRKVASLVTASFLTTNVLFTKNHALFYMHFTLNIITKWNNYLKRYFLILKGLDHWPLTRYLKLRVGHAPGMAGNRLQRKPLVSHPGMHHGTCATHVPWCMSGSLTRGRWENVPGILGAYATRNFTYLVRGPCPVIICVDIEC